MSARGGHLLEEQEGRTREVTLLAIARTVISRLDCLRTDGLGAEDDEIVASLAQFDTLASLVAIDDSGDIGGRDFYPNFSTVPGYMVYPIVNRLLKEPPMRAVLFTRADGDLALALRAVGEVAEREAIRLNGFEGWNPETNAFIAKNLPSDGDRGLHNQW